MAGESWDPPSDAALSPGGIGFSAHILAIRDLAAALAARASGSPWLNGIGAVEFFHTSDTWTVPAGVVRCQITIIGGGGAGGAGIDTNGGQADPGAGGGGGAGGVSIIGGLVVAPAENVTVTVGGGGAGGAGAGGNGAASSVARPASWTNSANGGSGGSAGTGGGASGGAGAAAVGTDGLPGARGEDGLVVGPELATLAWQGFSGAGAASFLGGGAPAVVSPDRSTDAVGHDATVRGAGGGGGYATNNSGTRTRNGGDGAAGLVIIEY